MKQSITSLILGIATAAAFTTPASAANFSSAPAEVKQAAPAPNEPAPELEFELMANDPDVLNRPPR